MLAEKQTSLSSSHCVLAGIFSSETLTQGENKQYGKETVKIAEGHFKLNMGTLIIRNLMTNSKKIGIKME